TSMELPALLNYLPSTQPQPLQVGIGTTPMTGTIDIYVSEPATTVLCKEITIWVPVGSDPGCLFAQRPTAAVNTGKWVQTSVEVVAGKTVGRADIEYTKFTYGCKEKNDYNITYNLVFSISGPAAAIPADCTVEVSELSATASDPNKFEPRDGDFILTLARPQLYLNNFVATADNAAHMPRTEFDNGMPIN